MSQPESPKAATKHCTQLYMINSSLRFAWSPDADASLRNSIMLDTVTPAGQIAKCYNIITFA